MQSFEITSRLPRREFSLPVPLTGEKRMTTGSLIWLHAKMLACVFGGLFAAIVVKNSIFLAASWARRRRPRHTPTPVVDPAWGEKLVTHCLPGITTAATDFRWFLANPHHTT